MSNIGNFSPDVGNELNIKGYHFLNTSLPLNSYPNKFPKFEKVNEIGIGKIYTLRLFVKLPSAGIGMIESGLLDVKVISKSKKGFIGVIQTLLPDTFPISKGQNIEIKKEEILYEQI